MRPFDLVLVLISMVLSLALAHLLTGLGRIIRAPKVRLSMVHTLWSIYLILECIDFWMSLWLGRNITWTLPLVLMTFVNSAALYLACWLAMPETERGEAIDFVAFYEADRRKILGPIVAYLALTTLYMATTGGLDFAWTAAVPLVATLLAFVCPAHPLQLLAPLITLGIGIPWFAHIWTFQ
jgi:hypothetical protein